MIGQRASEMNPLPIEWLWPNFLAAGNLAMLDGDPGLGKSLITLDLAARLTTGRAWPNGAPGPLPAPVYFLCEEDPDHVILFRLRTLGADMSRIFLWPRFGDVVLPRLPHDMDRLDEELAGCGAKLLVIDPILAFLDRNVLMANDADVRHALRPLAALGRKHHCVILLVRHLNKKTGQPALYRGGGSIAFIAACRLAWLVGRDPKVDDRFILAQPKNNFAPRQPSLAYTLARDAPRVEWQGECLWHADDLSARRRLRPTRQRAIEFIRSLLAAGPRRSQEAWQAAQREGFSESTIRRAKDALNVRHQLVPGQGRETTYWLLKGQVLPPDIAICPEVDAYFQKLEEQWSDRTPVD